MNYLVAVNRKFSDNPSGSARVAWDIACLARDQGHRVFFLCASERLSAGQSVKVEEDGMSIVRFAPRPKAWLPGPREYAKAAALAIRQHLSQIDFDVVHIHSLFLGLSVVATLGSDSRCVCTVHSPVVPEQRMNWESQGLLGRVKIALGGLQRLRAWQEGILARAARIHVLSEFTRGELFRYHRQQILKKLAVIPHWRRPGFQRVHSKAAARTTLGWPAEETVFLCVRRMVPRMGHAAAIRALSPLLGKHKARLVMAGAGSLFEPTRKLAAELEPSGRITFPGRVTDEQLQLMYSAADLFVLPTAALECFGLIIIEALGFGCPILATNVGAIPEALLPIMPDFLVPPNNVEQLRSKAESFLLHRLVSPPPDRIRDYVKGRYDVSVVGPRLLAFLFEP